MKKGTHEAFSFEIKGGRYEHQQLDEHEITGLRYRESAITAYEKTFNGSESTSRCQPLEKFLDNGVTRTLQTDLEAMKKVVRMPLNHKPMILNWFKAKGRLSSGAVEGLNWQN